MEKFVVSARKYRPNIFGHMLGQTHVVTTLKNAIRSEQIAHAFLFCGPRGVGKTTCARILAKAINCQQLTEHHEPCNACPSCNSFNQRASFNIYELDAASNNSVEDIRSLVEQVRYPPQSGRYKIYIIDEVHMLSQAAFNAFLKTLEEPPSYAVFILATTEKHKVLPTILSRCQIFDFQRIKPDDIVQQLRHVAAQENISCDEEALHTISLKSDGALRDALSMFDVIVSFGAGKLTYQATLENLHILDHSYYFRLTAFLLQGDIPSSLLIYDEIMQSGFDGLYFLEGLVAHFRNLLVAQDAQTVPLLEVAPSIQKQYNDQTQQTTPSFLLEALQIVNQCALQYKEVLHKRFHVELMLISLASKQTPNQPPTPSFSPSKNPHIPKEVPVKAPHTVPPVVNQPSVTAEDNQRVQELKVNDKLSTTTEHQPIKPTALQTTIRIPQLAAIKSVIEQSKVENSTNPPTKATPLVPFLTQDTINPHWKTYVQRLKSIGKIPAYNVLNQPIALEMDHTISIRFSNAVEEQIFNGIKEELVTYLRDQLRHPTLDVKAIFTPFHQGPQKPYTAQEKFVYLTTKYPHLTLLKDQLQLEVVN
eukprot:gene103-137_t